MLNKKNFLLGLYALSFIFLVITAGSVSAVENVQHFVPVAGITALDIHGDTVWYATSQSVFTINRHDGLQTRHDVLSGSGTITNLCIDGNGTAWISTGNSIVFSADDGGHWDYLNIPNDNLSFGAIFDIEIDSRNRVYVTQNGTYRPPGTEGNYYQDVQILNRFDGESWERLLDGNSIFEYGTMCIDEGRGLVFIASSGFLGTFNLETHSQDYTDFTGVSDFSVGRDGTVFAARTNGVYRYNGVSFTKMPGIDEEVTDVVTGSGDGLWLGTRSGLVYYHDGEVIRYSVDDGLFADHVQHISVDVDGVLWVATTGGLQSLKDGLFQLYTQESDMPCVGGDEIVVTKDNITYLLTYNSGLLRFDGHTWKTVKGYGHEFDCFSDDNIFLYRYPNSEYWDGTEWHVFEGVKFEQVCYDNTGKLWGASSDGIVLNLYTVDNGIMETITFDDIGCNGIEGLDCDSAGNVWFILRNYSLNVVSFIYRYDPAAGKLEQIELPNINYHSFMCFDNSDTLWILCSELRNGVHVYAALVSMDKDGHFSQYPLKEADNRLYKGPSHNFPDEISGICCDNKGTVWLCHRTDGLYRFADGAWNRYSTKSGELLSDSIRDAAVGPDGRLWLITMGGITVFDTSTGVEEKTVYKPGALAVIGNHPNPFNPSTTITFTLPMYSQATVTIYNLAGQTVRTLVDGAMRSGKHSIVWDGTNLNGTPVAAGVYLTRLRYGGTVVTGRMMLLK